MQHEVVLALLGCPGDLIRKTTDESGRPTYVVDPRVPFLSGAERAAIDQVAGLGACYETILAFVDGEELESAPASPRPPPPPPGGPKAVDGLYARALRTGLEEQLDEYRSVVVALEAELLADPSRPVSHLRYRLHAGHHHLTLPALCRLVEALARRGPPGSVAGAQLLEMLHDAAAMGPAPVTT